MTSYLQAVMLICFMRPNNSCPRVLIWKILKMHNLFSILRYIVIELVCYLAYLRRLILTMYLRDSTCKIASLEMYLLWKEINLASSSVFEMRLKEHLCGAFFMRVSLKVWCMHRYARGQTYHLLLMFLVVISHIWVVITRLQPIKLWDTCKGRKTSCLCTEKWKFLK